MFVQNVILLTVYCLGSTQINLTLVIIYHLDTGKQRVEVIFDSETQFLIEIVCSTDTSTVEPR